MGNEIYTYTLDQIQNFIKSNTLIDEEMCKRIIHSLSSLDINKEIAEILMKLSNANISPELKDNLKAASDSASKYLALVSGQQVVDSYSTEEEKEKLTSEQMLQKTLDTAEKNRMTVVESSVRKEDTPHITFDINHESKPYIDNLLLSLSEEKGLDLELSKINASNKELFTIAIDDKDLTEEQRQEKVNEILARVNEVIETTDKNKDYEELMPGKLKRMKQGFVNDQPDVNEEDYKIGYSNKGGVDSYYIVTSSKARAEEIAKEIGYELDMTVTDGNKFRIDTSGEKIEGTKLEQESEYMNVSNNTKKDSPVIETTEEQKVQTEENNDDFVIPLAVAFAAPAVANMAAMSTNPQTEQMTQQLDNKVMQKKLGSYPSNFKDAAYATFYILMITVMLAIAGFIAVKYLF